MSARSLLQEGEPELHRVRFQQRASLQTSLSIKRAFNPLVDSVAAALQALALASAFRLVRDFTFYLFCLFQLYFRFHPALARVRSTAISASNFLTLFAPFFALPRSNDYVIHPLKRREYPSGFLSRAGDTSTSFAALFFGCQIIHQIGRTLRKLLSALFSQATKRKENRLSRR